VFGRRGVRASRSSDLETVLGSGLFDWDYYREASGIAFTSARQAARHFLRTPSASLCDPHPLFSAGWYLQTYPDVAASGINPFIHFLRHGAGDARSPSA
jgi:hypothetical protein